MDIYKFLLQCSLLMFCCENISDKEDYIYIFIFINLNCASGGNFNFRKKNSHLIIINQLVGNFQFSVTLVVKLAMERSHE
jgi:hypothetical protein